MTTPEKITDDELEFELDLCPDVAREKINTHIAALTAERDVHVRQLESESAKVLRLEEEAVSLRERVQALENEAADVRAGRAGWRARAEVAERTLAAIRQRAGDSETMGKAAAGKRWPALSTWARGRFAEDAQAVARYLLGEDATGAATCGNCEGVQPETCATHPEPTTAEAFATVREGIGNAILSQADDARVSLALLERRMGAMEIVLVRMVDAEAAIRASTFGGEELVSEARAALTDAPPVFTLEEVEQALRAVHGKLAMTDGVRAHLAALRKVTP